MVEPSVEGAVFQAAFIPKQRIRPGAVSDDMLASIATYPPLEQVSQLAGPDVTFTALLEVPQHLAAESWELSLWHSSGEGKEWTETPFALDETIEHAGELHEPSNALKRLYFTTRPSPVQISVNFTVKFRQGPDHGWRWIRDEQELGDGIVLVQGPEVEENSAEKLPDLIHQLNPDLTWRSHMSQCPNTQLWSIQAPVPGTKEETSAFVDITLGVPWGKFLRYVGRWGFGWVFYADRRQVVCFGETMDSLAGSETRKVSAWSRQGCPSLLVPLS